MNKNEVKLLGYVSDKEHLSERVIDKGGVSFTLMAMTHGYGQGYIGEYEEDNNAT